ncbi:MAG: hypothetical protein ICV66_11055 [Chitinophagaceae bacterium]|nr:hypothetical protein [Chitinophagaceae bacterium]
MKQITPDKWKHFFVGIVMGAILQALLLWLLSANHFFSIIGAFIMVVAISYGFELFSKITGKGHYDFIDAIAGTVGGVLGMSVIILLQLYLFG